MATTWTNGDSSGSQTLATTDHLYNTHVNELREAVNDVEAITDNVSASDTAKLAAITSSATELNVLDGVPSTLTYTELGYVDGVTSAIQTQINTKQATIIGAATTIDTEDLTASRALSSNASGKVAVATTTLAELNHVNGVTSAIQTQINTKQAVPNRSTVASDATPNPVGSAEVNIYTITALAEAAEFAAPSGTPVDGNVLRIRILDDGTGRALTYNAIYRAIGITLPTTTTANKTLYIGATYNSADTKWDCVATREEA